MDLNDAFYFVQVVREGRLLGSVPGAQHPEVEAQPPGEAA